LKIYKHKRLNKMRVYNLARKKERKINSPNFRIYKRNNQDNRYA